MYERSRNLMDCHIAGFNYYEGIDVIKKLKIGTKVTLKGEPKNPCDAEAIAVYYKKKKLGYIPQDKNSTLSTLIYFGYKDILEARINSRDIKAHPERQFRIVIRLKDNREVIKKLNCPEDLDCDIQMESV